MMTVKTVKGQPVGIGRQGENLVTFVQHTYDPTWSDEDYSVEIYARRPRETAAYAVANVSDDRDAGVVTWTVSSADTGNAGEGRMMVRFVDENGAVLKSESFKTLIGSAVDSNVGEAPDVYETWLATLMEYADSTTENATVCSTKAQEASESEALAAASSESAAQSATEAAASAAEAEAFAPSATYDSTSKTLTLGGFS